MRKQNGSAILVLLLFSFLVSCDPPPKNESKPPPPPKITDPDERDRMPAEESSRPRATAVSLPSASQQYHTVEVFFGTDRRPNASFSPENGNKRYGHERHRENRKAVVEYGKTAVSIPKHHRTGVVERPKWYKLEFSEDPKKHVVILSLEKMSADNFFTSLSTKASGTPKNEAFVFIHGFNMSFDESVRRTAQIAFDLDFGGVAITYSWPSRGKIASYSADESSAEWAEPQLAKFFQDLQAKGNFDKIHVMAHSMGTRVTAKAIADTAGLDITNLILAAPDIDTEIFEDALYPKLIGKAETITMYSSSDDSALKVSEVINGYSRLGLSGSRLFVTDGMDTVDASGVDTSVIGHEYFGSHQKVVLDLYNLIIKGLAPAKRKLVPGQIGEWDFALD